MSNYLMKCFVANYLINYWLRAWFQMFLRSSLLVCHNNFIFEIKNAITEHDFNATNKALKSCLLPLYT